MTTTQQHAKAPVAPPPTTTRKTPGKQKNSDAWAHASRPGPSRAVRDTITATHATLAVGGLAHLADVPPIATGAFGLVLTGVGAAWANHDYAEIGFGTACGASVGGWLLWSVNTTPWTVPHLCALVTGAVALGTWYSKIRRMRRLAAKQPTTDDTIQHNTAAHPGSDDARNGWQRLLEKAQVKGAVVTHTEPLGGSASGFRVSGRLTDPKFDYASLSHALAALELVADHHTDYPIRPGSIQLSRPKNPTAGQFQLSIPTVNVFGEKIPHPLNHEPRSIEDPIEFATAADGSRLSAVHADSAHAMFSGMTDFGKSNLLNVFIYEWTRSVDCETWLMSGSDKSAKLIKPLLRAWLKGEVPNPPIDRFAANEKEAMYMLWDAKQGISKRAKGTGIDDLSSKWKVTPDTPRIVIGIEEAGDFLASRVQYKMPDGKKWTFGQLLLEVIRKARSEAINLVMLTQGGTMDLTGDFGSAIKKQILFRVAFHAQASTEINACLSSDTSRVEHGELDKGEIYVEQAGSQRPVLALADYMADDADNNVMDIAARHHYQYARSIDEATASAMPFYADRWTRPAQQQYLAALMGVDTLTTPDPTTSRVVTEDTPDPDDDTTTDTTDITDPDDHAAQLNDIITRYQQQVEAETAQAEIDQLEQLYQQPSRSLGDLDPATLRVLGVLQKITEPEITAADLRTRVADELGMDPNSTETDRHVNAAIQDILGVDDIPLHVKRRRSVGESKMYVWSMDAIRTAIRDLQQ